MVSSGYMVLAVIKKIIEKRVCVTYRFFCFLRHYCLFLCCINQASKSSELCHLMIEQGCCLYQITLYLARAAGGWWPRWKMFGCYATNMRRLRCLPKAAGCQLSAIPSDKGCGFGLPRFIISSYDMSSSRYSTEVVEVSGWWARPLPVTTPATCTGFLDASDFRFTGGKSRR